MEARDLMTREPDVCLPTDSCAVAADIMRRRPCGFVPVVDGPATRRVVGVVTDRDLALYLAQADCCASEAPVSACMTREVKTVTQDAELEEVARTMEGAGVHRLPVIERGRLVGVLSLSDLALAARKEWASPGPHRAGAQLLDILEAIAAARTAL